MAKLYHCGEYLDTSIKFSDITDLPKINNVEIKGSKDSVNDLKIPGKVVSAPAGSGEVFNDYTNNIAVNYAHAEGSNTKASGPASHSEGVDTEASGGNAHAEGYKTKAPGSYAHAEGNASEASGTDSHAEGHGTLANKHSAHAEGRDTEASGDASHAEGYITKATNNYSHSEGSNTTASGSNSHAEGAYTKATHDCSHAEGNRTEAANNNAHAEGYGTIAKGIMSHAEGYNTLAEGAYSHAGGMYTEARNEAQTALGKYNDNQTNSLFEVGNGNGNTSRSNAFEVFKDGHINVNGDYYQYGKKVNFGNDYTLPTASATVKGGVKIGSGLQMVGDVLNAISSGGGINYRITPRIYINSTATRLGPISESDSNYIPTIFNLVETFSKMEITIPVAIYCKQPSEPGYPDTFFRLATVNSTFDYEVVDGSNNILKHFPAQYSIINIGTKTITFSKIGVVVLDIEEI